MASPAGTSSASYLDNGWERERDLPNGTITGYALNGVGALTAQSSPNLAGYGSFTYDGAFNPTGLTANVPGAPGQSGTTTYAYDAKDRLTAESSSRLGGYSQGHAYDASGNPTTFRGTAQTFDADNRQAGPGAFAYDGNGSATTDRGIGLAYDPEARATQIGPSLSAGYRADGLRAWKSVGGARTYLYYDRGEPVAELDASGSVTATNVFAPDGLVARGTASGWTQYAFDPEGNVAQRLDAGGNVLSSSVYDAYGAETTTGSAPSDPFGYHGRSGYYLDRETGLVLCRHRYYDPGTGRWVTRDPIGFAGGVNLYGYCGGGPIGASDPSGHEGGGGAEDSEPPRESASGEDRPFFDPADPGADGSYIPWKDPSNPQYVGDKPSQGGTWPDDPDNLPDRFKERDPVVDEVAGDRTERREFFDDDTGECIQFEVHHRDPQKGSWADWTNEDEEEPDWYRRHHGWHYHYWPDFPDGPRQTPGGLPGESYPPGMNEVC